MAKGIVVSRQSSERILLNDFVTQWREVGADAQAALQRVGESGWLILGREVKSFEAELAAFCQVPHAVGCASGLDAIEIALRVLGLQPGDKVITTPLSAFATTLAIVRAGGVPVFVDVDGSGLLDLERVAHALSRDRSIKFCLPVHLYGHALDARALERIAALPGVQVVEDCAQAIGAQSRGKPVGSTGAIAATSFYPTKNLGALGDGGALLLSSAELAAQAQCLRDYGQSAKYVHAQLGMNSRLDELQAAILRSALLPRLPQLTARRRAIADAYRLGLTNPALQVPHIPDGSSSVWHLFPVLVDGPRAELVAHLDRAGIGSAVHYPTLIPDQPALAHVRFERLDSLTMAEHFAESELSLPIHPYLSDEQVERVIAACNSWTP